MAMFAPKVPSAAFVTLIFPASDSVPVPVIDEPLLAPPACRFKALTPDIPNVESASVDPALTVSGAEVNVLAALSVIVPVFYIITPPVLTKDVGHSLPAVLAVLVLY